MMGERDPWTTTNPGMEEFEDWQEIFSAPIDGTAFLGANEPTGNVYETWFHPRWGSPIEVEEGDISKAVVWWCRDASGKVTSFLPTHWRPSDIPLLGENPPK